MNKIEDLKKYAKENKVPIIFDEGLEFLLEQIKKHEVKTVLEVGTAIAYSAINMVLAGASLVVTIERDEKMITQAKQNIKDFSFEQNIKLIEGDALNTYDEVKNQKYDLIFIDAAKGSYQKFFELYENLLSDNGIIVCDNMDFHGLADKNADLSMYSRGLRSMIRKLLSFRENLLNNKNYDTKFYHVGDGMTVSEKIKIGG